MICIILWVYICLSSTFGAWWLASNKLDDEGEDITLFDIVGNILPAIIFCWFLVPLTLLMMIKVKKLK